MMRPLNRSAVGSAIACGVFLMGPLTTGAAISHADLAGLGGGGGGINVLGVDVLGGNAKKSGGVSGMGTPAVSTAPSTRSVVIRAKPAVAEPASAPAPVAVSASMADVPAQALDAPAVSLHAPAVEAPIAVPPPAAPPVPMAGPVIVPPRPDAMPVPTTIQPGPGRRMGPVDKLAPPTRVPASFRLGYAEYLRAATTGDLLAAALPGVAGIAGFTVVGAYAGYRQAKAVQRALLAPVPTSILL